ncbi:MAG: signal peptide peptidase SppA [Oligoflexus sp.]
MTERRRENPIIRFFRIFFYAITGFFAVIGVGVTVLTIALVTLFFTHSKNFMGGSAQMEVPNIEKSLVHIKIDGPIITRDLDPTQVFLGQLFGETGGYQLSELQKTLNRAAEDIRVHAVYLDLVSISGGFSTMTELRRSLAEYRSSGKPLYVNLYDGNTANFYLASAANQINLSPIGGMMIPGPAFQLTYFSSALNKLGVEFEVFRAGAYKSAFESFIRDTPSDETLEMYQAMEQSLRNELVEAIATGRGRTIEEVRSWLQRSIFTSKQALAMGLIDRLGYHQDWLDALQEETKSEHVVAWRPYLRASHELDEPRMAEDQDSKLAYIEAYGEIRMAASPSEDPVITPERLIARLKWAKEQEDIKAVVLRIDSPGGSALASDMIWEEVRKLAETKPLVVSMGNVAASGGYYIAAPAGHILAEATTITGSIGVIGAAINGQQFDEKYGISFHVVTGSDRSDYLNFGKPASEKDKELIGEGIDEVYTTFLQKVAQGRKKTVPEIDRLAQGRVYTGQEALALGLVDSIGGRQEALAMAKELAQLNPKKLYPLAQYTGKPTSIFDCFARSDRFLQCMQELENSWTWTALFERPLAKIGLDQPHRILRMLEEDRYFMFWPGELKWQENRRVLP